MNQQSEHQLKTIAMIDWSQYIEFGNHNQSFISLEQIPIRIKKIQKYFNDQGVYRLNKYYEIEQNMTTKLIEQLKTSVYSENIVKYYFLQEKIDINNDYLTHTTIGMEDCGSDLRSLRLNIKNENEIKQTVVYLQQLLKGMKFLQEIFPDFCHRDLALDNIFLQNGSNVKIGDFGISSTQQQLQSKIGKRIYMAPEVSSGNYDNRCDIYSLGMTILRLLFPQVELRKSQSVIDFEGGDELPLDFFSLLDSMLKDDPNERVTWKELYEFMNLEDIQKYYKKEQSRSAEQQYIAHQIPQQQEQQQYQEAPQIEQNLEEFDFKFKPRRNANTFMNVLSTCLEVEDDYCKAKLTTLYCDHALFKQFLEQKIENKNMHCALLYCFYRYLQSEKHTFKKNSHPKNSVNLQSVVTQLDREMESVSQQINKLALSQSQLELISSKKYSIIEQFKCSSFQQQKQLMAIKKLIKIQRNQ